MQRAGIIQARKTETKSGYPWGPADPALGHSLSSSNTCISWSANCSIQAGQSHLVC